MGKSKKNFAEFIVAPADASSFGGPSREGQAFGQTAVYFKRNLPDMPYRVANEYICSTLTATEIDSRQLESGIVTGG